MKRAVTKDIVEWYQCADDRVLLIYGGWYVGKTRCVIDFCQDEGIKYTYIPMDRLEGCTGRMEPDSEIMVIDNIEGEKQLRDAYSMVLKLRCEQCLPAYRIILIYSGVNVPDGMIDEAFIQLVKVHSLSYDEFKKAMSDSYLAGMYTTLSSMDILKLYLVVGGMPECVELLIRKEELSAIRHRQLDIIKRIWERVGAKRKTDGAKCHKLLDSIAYQSMEDGAGFSLSRLHKNARAREYAHIIDELQRCGIIYRTGRYDIEQSSHGQAYKLHIVDVGLAGALAGIHEDDILHDEHIQQWRRGYHLWRLVASELVLAGCMDAWDISYWHKQRAKARLPIVLVEKISKEVVVINLPMSKTYSYSRSIDAFIEEYPHAKVKNLSIHNIIDGIFA